MKLLIAEDDALLQATAENLMTYWGLILTWFPMVLKPLTGLLKIPESSICTQPTSKQTSGISGRNGLTNSRLRKTGKWRRAMKKPNIRTVKSLSPFPVTIG